METKKKRAGIEWVGGLVSMPAYITGEGEPYRPEALLWMGAEGAVLGHEVGRPGELLGVASDSLRSAIERPIFGRPHAPDRVRVASGALADALRAAHPELEVVCTPTPEIDAVLAAMGAHSNEAAGFNPSYLSPELGPEAIGSFFRAAAGLFRAKPWKIVPNDRSLFSVTIEQLGVQSAAMSVMGQVGQSLGLILFSGLDDFEAYLEAADTIEHGEMPTLPPHLALSFEPATELSAALREEVVQHRWEVADADAYPSLLAVGAELVVRPPTPAEVAIAEAISVALPRVLEEKRALLAAWKGGAPLERTLAVTTHAGDVAVTLRVPYARPPAEFGVSSDVIADLLALGQGGEEIDPEALRRLQDELVRRFVASPEGEALPNVQWCRCLMDLAAKDFGATVASLRAPQLRELVFELIPRQVSVKASAAGAIITELRAFYGFLQREFALEEAESCLRALADDAVKKLYAALSNTSNFGNAKALFMAGNELGFDMTSREGIEAYMRMVQAQLLPAPVRSLPSVAKSRPVSPAAARARKNQRKASRKARKKNR